MATTRGRTKTIRFGGKTFKLTVSGGKKRKGKKRTTKRKSRSTRKPRRNSKGRFTRR